MKVNYNVANFNFILMFIDVLFLDVGKLLLKLFRSATLRLRQQRVI